MKRTSLAKFKKKKIAESANKFLFLRTESTIKKKRKDFKNPFSKLK
jgi:hypothetical protein